jgi:hypothetical protein
VDALLARYQARVESPRDFALAHRVVLLRTADGVGIDIALGGLPFECNTVARASDFEFASGERIRTCSAEDLLTMKAFAGRDQDWLDVKGVLIRQGDRLNWKLILSELRPLCELKPAPETLARLEQLREQVEGKTTK